MKKFAAAFVLLVLAGCVSMNDMDTSEAAQARREAILRMLQNQPKQAPVQFYPMQIPQTTTTNCYAIGNQMNCTSR